MERNLKQTTTCHVVILIHLDEDRHCCSNFVRVAGFRKIHDQ